MKARLTRKLGPLPVWAWAALVLGAYLAYTRFRPSTALDANTSSAGETPVSPDPAASTDSGSGAQLPASGMGNPADQLAPVLPDYSSQFDALNGQLQQLPTFADLGPIYDKLNSLGAPPGQESQDGPASSPSSVQTGQAASRAAHLTQQPGAGKLNWGGRTFTTQAGFDAWARAHGVSTAQALNNYPQARAIYSTLKPPSYKQQTRRAPVKVTPVRTASRAQPQPQPKLIVRRPQPKPKPAPRRVVRRRS